jgi:Holliday junction resolvasome RuvABC endonuclease subunit
MLVRILAFDPGTANMGYSTLQGNTKQNIAALDGAHFGVLKTSKWNGTAEVEIRERIDRLGAMIKQRIIDIEPTHIAIEDFVEQGKLVGKTYKEMAYLTEHIRLLTRELGVPATIYPNGVWKKKTLGIMRANKAQVQHYVAHKLPEAVELLKKQPDHVWDSAGIGYCKWLDILAELNDGGIK